MKNRIWAIIPARSGSRGLKDKNIKILNKTPLIGHAIKFALKTNIFDKVLLSTDSNVYAEIGKKQGAWIPFLRSEKASESTSMEEDIHIDIHEKLKSMNILAPDIIVWLRPTFPFRKIEDLLNAINLLDSDTDSVRIVVEAESRIYTTKGEYLTPFPHLPQKSMIRRQDIPSAYSVYHTDIYWYKNIHKSEHFLGDKIKPYIVNKICRFDIDTIYDFEIIESLIKCNPYLLNDYIHG